MARLLIGNVKGPQGDQGEQGVQGVPGNAATVNVGSTTTSAYGTQARVTNSGTPSNAIFDFVIPQGAPGEEVTEVGELTVDAITASQAEYPTYTVGEKMKAVLGKIAKYLDDLKTTVNSVSTALSGKAPTNHASTGTDYGVGNATDYGHVRLSDTYNSNVGGAANSIGASQSAVYGAYNALHGNINDLNGKAVSLGAIAASGSTTYTRPVTGNGLFAVIFCKRNSVSETTFSVYALSKLADGFVVSKISENEQAKLSFTYDNNTGVVGITNTSTIYVYISILSFDFVV